jgi:hypothetical protein
LPPADAEEAAFGGESEFALGGDFTDDFTEICRVSLVIELVGGLELEAVDEVEFDLDVDTIGSILDDDTNLFLDSLRLSPRHEKTLLK